MVLHHQATLAEQHREGLAGSPKSSRWEDIDPTKRRPARRYYKLTSDGFELALGALAWAHRATARPAWPATGELSDWELRCGTACATVAAHGRVVMLTRIKAMWAQLRRRGRRTSEHGFYDQHEASRYRTMHESRQDGNLPF